MEKRSCYLIRLSIESLTQTHAHINVNNDMITLLRQRYIHISDVCFDRFIIVHLKAEDTYVCYTIVHTYKSIYRNTKMHSSATKRGINNKSMQTRDCATKGARDEKIKRERKRTKS